jgi:two-component system chemotaxis response regulator CheB
VIGVLVVALVCSAGGLEALRRALAPLPADFTGCVVIVQHQPPHADRDLLASLLRRRTRLPVEVAIDGAPLRRGMVLVVPPGRHALIDRDERIVLIPAGPVPPPRPSGDLLLTTLALAVGPRAVAVVLSGTGRDGATGASAVHRFGGTVIAADEASSAHFGMPGETIGRDDAVDHVLPVDDIAPLLTRLASR